MKTFISVILTIFLFSFISCSTTNFIHNYEYMKPNANVNNNIGYLKIFTAKFEEKGQFADDPIKEFYKGYSIYSTNGDFIRDVKNSYETPALVLLEEGEYVVVAELHKNVVQSFLIIVEKGKMLEIDESMVEEPLAVY